MHPDNINPYLALAIMLAVPALLAARHFHKKL
jgi:hypothetical protein